MFLFRGQLSRVETKTILLTSAQKGEVASELTGCVKAVRRFEPPCLVLLPFLIDVSGTGGDQKGTFNISTVAGLVVAAAGGYVAKHGNRAVSSKTGSSDLMEALGIRIDIPFSRMCEALQKFHFGYFHAPIYHPSFSSVQPLRRELGVRTLFNLVGPLVNPVELSYQMIGVSNLKWLLPAARTLASIGRKRSAVFRSEDGMDELSTQVPSDILYVERNQIRAVSLNPRKLGFTRAGRRDYGGGDLRTNAEIARGILEHRIRDSRRDVVLLNSGLALWLAGVATTLREGIERSRWAIRSGCAAHTLGALREYTCRRN